MTIITDNIKNGCIDGLGRGATGSQTGTASLIYVSATPDEVLTGQLGSDIAYDVNAGELYMCEAKGGSEWIRLGSVQL